MTVEAVLLMSLNSVNNIYIDDSITLGTPIEQINERFLSRREQGTPSVDHDHLESNG